MKKLEEIINEHKTQDGALIPVLHEAQELFGYLPEKDQQTVLTARKLERFLTQPFYTTYQFTGMEGRSVDLEKTIDGCNRIIEGEFMRDLSNENVVHVRKNGVEFLQFRKLFEYSNIINLYIQTAFYALLATGVFYVISPDEIGEKAFIKAILPFGFNLYWYFTAYFCMFFFIPFMNKVLETCDKKQLTGLVVFSIMFFSVFPLIFEKDIFFTNNGYSVIWISILYMIGGYIRKYEIYKKISNLKCVVLYFAG